mgnify:CR=1 FL=1
MSALNLGLYFAVLLVLAGVVAPLEGKTPESKNLLRAILGCTLTFAGIMFALFVEHLPLK